MQLGGGDAHAPQPEGRAGTSGWLRTRCAASGQFLNLSEFPFPHLENGDGSTADLAVSFRGSDKLTRAERPKRRPEHGGRSAPAGAAGAAGVSITRQSRSRRFTCVEPSDPLEGSRGLVSRNPLYPQGSGSSKSRGDALAPRPTLRPCRRGTSSAQATARPRTLPGACPQPHRPPGSRR